MSNKRFMQMTVERDEALLLGALAHIRVLLEDAGICIRRGIILYLEDGEKMDSVLRDLEEYGIVSSCLQGRMKPEFPNYVMGIVPFSRSYATVRFQEFLECKGFLPSVLVCGVLPDFFEGKNNVILLKMAEEGNEDEERDLLSFENFERFVHENVAFVCKCILKFYDLNRYKMYSNQSKIRIALEATAHILVNFYWQEHDEESTVCFRDKLQKLVENMCQTGLCGCYDNVTEVVAKFICKYLDENQGIAFRELSRMRKKMCGRIEAGGMILYDDEFYYISDQMLRMFCEPLQGNISYLAVKTALHREGALVNDRTENQSYTVKLLLYDLEGKAVRIRVIKLERKALDGKDGLTLIERRGTSCMLENAKKGDVRSQNQHRITSSQSQEFQAQGRPAR